MDTQNPSPLEVLLPLYPFPESVSVEKVKMWEYDASLDFKSKTGEAFKVEQVEAVKQENDEIIVLSVRGGQPGHVSSDPLREECESWGFVKSESGHLLGSENEAPNRRKDLEKMEISSDSGAGSRENGVVVWVKEETEPDLKKEVVQPRPVVIKVALLDLYKI